METYMFGGIITIPHWRRVIKHGIDQLAAYR